MLNNIEGRERQSVRTHRHKRPAVIALQTDYYAAVVHFHSTGSSVGDHVIDKRAGTGAFETDQVPRIQTLDSWASISKIGFNQNEIAQYAAPGHWNDPDMLEIGNGGMTDTEYRTHMSLWSILAVPLVGGNDLQNMSPAILAILTNREVIAVDQDRAGKEGMRASVSGDQQIWVKDLADGSKAIELFNLASDLADVKVKWANLGFSQTPQHARDLWLHKDMKLQGPDYTASVPGHGVVMLRVLE